MMRELVIDSLNLWVTVPNYFDLDSMFDVLDDCIETISGWISCYCILVQMDEMLISSR